jgi:predicted RNA polymerase sigma factor
MRVRCSYPYTRADRAGPHHPGQEDDRGGRVPFELPLAGERRGRLGGGLSVLYVIFTEGSHLVPTVRGELLARLGRRPEARAELELAARLCANQRERSVLLRKAATLD